ncbi:DUF4192 family protein [Tersicoccus sp. MR15.9]|uniref:DUF4192 family protein n=1 Tax=Tersicoccus mangrovi TaxID=3121635 RepID=UPI002FE678D8
MTPSPAAAIRTAEDLLAYVPHGIGHWPRESLVVLADSGGAAGGLLRLDLPPRRTAAVGAEIARYVHTVLAPGSPHGVFVVVYTAARPRPGSGLPVLVHRLVRTLERLGLAIVDCLYVTDDGWGHVDRASADAPWSRRRPLADITSSVLNTELVFAGHTWGTTPESAVPPAGTGPDAEEVRRWSAVHAPGPRPDPADPAWVRAMAGAWEDGLTVLGAASDGPAPPLEPELAGRLLAGLRSRTVRDLVLFQSAVGPSPVIADLLLGAGPGAVPAEGAPSRSDPERDGRHPEPGRVPGTGSGDLPEDQQPDGDRANDRLPDDLGATGGSSAAESCARQARDRDACLRAGGLPLLACVITGTVALAPDWTRLNAAHRLLEALAFYAEGEARCATLTLLGWIEFARGRGSRAHHCLDAALLVDPRYELARLFDRFLDLGQVHEWARHRSTAWKADGHDAA